jgi:hypothetical protein
LEWENFNLKEAIITIIIMGSELCPWIDYSKKDNTSRGQLSTHGFFI